MVSYGEWIKDMSNEVLVALLGAAGALGAGAMSFYNKLRDNDMKLNERLFQRINDIEQKQAECEEGRRQDREECDQKIEALHAKLESHLKNVQS